MAFCITFGMHEFSSQLEGYENVRAYCYNCQHWNGHCITRWPFFTVCFIPLIPLAVHKYKESNATHAVTLKTYGMLYPEIIKSYWVARAY
ncbi:hypothetical protein PDIDSM_5165 [Penicillium digitatum]|nr:hypothetical protein PDIDSM_5165 [Penicillium digitatum]